MMPWHSDDDRDYFRDEDYYPKYGPPERYDDEELYHILQENDAIFGGVEDLEYEEGIYNLMRRDEVTIPFACPFGWCEIITTDHYLCRESKKRRLAQVGQHHARLVDNSWLESFKFHWGFWKYRFPDTLTGDTKSEVPFSFMAMPDNTHSIVFGDNYVRD